MDAASTSRPGARRWRSALIIGIVSVASAVVLALAYPRFTLGRDVAFPTFQGACERIRESGIPPVPGDWWCSSPAWHLDANVIIRTLLSGIGIGFALAVLAATGRRASALLVLIPVMFFGSAINTNTALSPLWLTGDTLRWIFWWTVPLLALAAPAIVVARIAHRDLQIERAGLKGRLLAGALCVILSLGVLVFVQAMFLVHFDTGQRIDFVRGLFHPGEWLEPEMIRAAFMVMIFGALLGRQRPWWPWAIAVAAFFMSQGLAGILYFEWNPEGTRAWTEFGSVLPLFLLGLVWSNWGAWAQRVRSGSATGSASPPAMRAAVPSRPVAAVMAVAGIGLLAASLIMFVAEQIATPLPTYLRTRDQANDVRARMNLAEAMTSLDAYRQRTGTFEGFDVASSSDSSLAWVDARNADDHEALTVRLLEATDRVARVEVLSNSDAAFCLEHRAGSSWRYGSGAGTGESENSEAALAAAAADCGSKPWTADLVARPDFPTCRARTPGFLICRMVSVLMFNILEDRV